MVTGIGNWESIAADVLLYPPPPVPPSFDRHSVNDVIMRGSGLCQWPSMTSYYNLQSAPPMAAERDITHEYSNSALVSFLFFFIVTS